MLLARHKVPTPTTELQYAPAIGVVRWCNFPGTVCLTLDGDDAARHLEHSSSPPRAGQPRQSPGVSLCLRSQRYTDLAEVIEEHRDGRELAGAG